jgi:cytochrome c553
MKMRTIARGFALVIGVVAMTSSQAANLEAGRAKAATVCAACHGATGVSVSDEIPNLAGQRAAYLIDQLQAFKEGTRKSDIMNVIAPQLSQDDIVDVASHFAAQQGAVAGAKSALLPNIEKSHIVLPASFDRGFHRYLVKDGPEGKSVSIYYASDVAFDSAKAGKTLPNGSEIFIGIYSTKLGADGKPARDSAGQLVPDQLRGVTAMASGKGWGADIPEMLRNDDWNYAIFGGDRTMRTGINQAECLACHKPKAGDSYLFLHDALVAATKK